MVHLNCYFRFLQETAWEKASAFSIYSLFVTTNVARAITTEKKKMKKILMSASILALAGSATADLVYSGELNLTVSSGDSAIDVGIGSNMWQFGIEVAGPLDYSFITALNEGAGVFVPLLNETSARNFAAGDNFGTLTPPSSTCSRSARATLTSTCSCTIT